MVSEKSFYEGRNKMKRKLLELLNAINEKKVEIKNLVDNGDIEKAKAEKDKLKDMQNKFDILKDLDDEELEGMQNRAEAGAVSTVTVEEGAADPEETPKDAVHEFANAARNRFRVSNDMSEGSKVDGGYTVPEDIQTQINTRREAKASLIHLVDVEPVSTNKGSRTFKKRSQQTGFTQVGEGGKVQKKETPQFERMDYEVKKYAGYFPVTNELFEDSDANITSVLVTWIGDESRVTRNNIIREVINKNEKTEISGLDGIKKVLNVTLGSAFKATSKVVTNDDGLQYLDTLKDSEGKYLLQPNPADPMKLRLCAGATIVPVEVMPNSDFPSDTNTAGKRGIPMVIGDLKEGIKFFDRKQITIISSNIASAGDLNAFEEDLTLFRAIEREDCRMKDDQAFVNGVITIDDASVTGAAAKAALRSAKK